MEDLPLKKLRNFGGKLGAELEALGATTAGQVPPPPCAHRLADLTRRSISKLGLMDPDSSGNGHLLLRFAAPKPPPRNSIGVFLSRHVLV